VAIVVVTDANVLINLAHVGKLPLLGALDCFDFRVPTEVLAEISEPEQRAAVDAGVKAGYLKEIAVEAHEALQLLGELRGVMGHGEAACLALAATSGFHIASDEKRRFRRKAVELLGPDRIIRTESILLEAIRREYISVTEADGCKAILESKKYAMSFASFADLL
jgi:predicted nucleic acid-binding protein